MKVEDIKSINEKVSVLTCYDYSFAKTIDGAVDIILVGDSVGNVVYGLDSTREVTMDIMIQHVKAVRKGVSKSLLVADMPFGSDKDAVAAVDNASKLVEAGADAVKVEGKPDIVKELVSKGFAVMGHVGLLPQTAETMRKYGKDDKEAKEILQQAKDISDAGAFAIVIESVPGELAKLITSQVKVPTIGIGAGKDCSGQVLVLYDMIGLFENVPSFVKRYISLSTLVKDAAARYSKEVKEGKFP
ncbi:MAG: 3-methyl-2-oxobutanoate hydroxymethyltransferase [Nanoarchaeota archaeon]|nr:3-methyl-2-oxobutanoate hydroxymethyltransferase [Nanoarchaeota archaeon]MBU1703873.1 3-methyl-2-oxobutanoate hydroxymethyltransferase [Nanoarchaeota archaeon]